MPFPRFGYDWKEWLQETLIVVGCNLDGGRDFLFIVWWAVIKTHIGSIQWGEV